MILYNKYTIILITVFFFFLKEESWIYIFFFNPIYLEITKLMINTPLLEFWVYFLSLRTKWKQNPKLRYRNVFDSIRENHCFNICLHAFIFLLKFTSLEQTTFYLLVKYILISKNVTTYIRSSRLWPRKRREESWYNYGEQCII